MKPIRSTSVQKLFGKPELNGIDAEILYGPWNASNVFNVTTSAVMSTNMPEGFLDTSLSLAVFDHTATNSDFAGRKIVAAAVVYCARNDNIKIVPQMLVRNEKELLEFEAESLEAGYEGVMVRGTSISHRYKQGRSTAKEGIIGKIKRFSDAEAIVVGFEEKMTNTNEAKINELGRTQRSQAIEGMVGAGTLGALICECNGIHFTMGSGFDDAGRSEVWNNKEKFLGKLAKFKYFAIGMKDSFRFPIFQGWRDADDL